ncbi:type 1 fimbrial protein [Pectobacterium aroidearum]|uniref:type 1 fimbrial protein n=1 Tax=Pectobacterium aroidearum TaxID=1201031 RepID=UPI0015DFAE7C|nr:type 1 fimbrial protein [Pectobacterium aroidearum]MBA0204745.1 type 1 fimbrial protein [Pectobacterium aroidearum]
MKKILQKTAILLCIVAATPYTFASSSSSTGIIRFVGAIVEPVCDVTTQSSNVTVSCERQGRAQTLQMKNGSHYAALPQSIGSVSAKTLSSNVRIVTVSYE